MSKTGKNISSPWEDKKPNQLETAYAETAKSSLRNPFSDMRHEKINPDQAPLSPTHRKPMIAVKIGAVDGPKVRVWVSPEERIVLPRLRKTA